MIAPFAAASLIDFLTLTSALLASASARAQSRHQELGAS
jgi:hypothetical protein